MTGSRSSQDLWKAPAGDGQTLLWPESRTLLEQTRDNQAALSASVARIGNMPLSELRREARRWVGHEEGRPFIATGHQIELVHPGVWAKNIVIDQLARRLDGTAYHLAVDTDAPKHLLLRWPGGAGPLSDDERAPSLRWAGALAAPTPAHIDRLRKLFQRSAGQWPFVPMMGEFFDALRPLLLDAPGLTQVLLGAIDHIEASLGLRLRTLLVSPIWHSPAYLALAHHLLANAGQFAQVYNATLAEFRNEQGIKSPGRPWPDLKCIEGSCEAPFWFDSLDTGERARAGVTRMNGQSVLRLRDADFVLDPALEALDAAQQLQRFLAQSHCRLSPRAMTLTLFARLLLADQFVHGIGGARYDQVTDRVMQRFFGINPPAFSVATATLLFPTAPARRLDPRPLLLEGRRLRHGAYFPGKELFLRRISHSPRRSPERRRLFADMHQRLQQALEDPRYIAWQSRLEQAQSMSMEQATLFDRELFFAIQPRNRLIGLIDSYASLLNPEPWNHPPA